MSIEDPIFKAYLKDISYYPLIDANKEKELATIIKHSDDIKVIEKAKEELINANLRLVVKYALQYYNKVIAFTYVRLTLMDFIAEGNIALIRCVESFDPEIFKTKFSTYATKAIKRKIQRAIQNSRFIRVPFHHYSGFSKINQLKTQYGDNITDEILLKEMDVTPEMLEMIKNEISYDMAHFVQIDDILEIIPANNKTQDKDNELKEYVLSKINEMKPKDQDVLFFKLFGNDISGSEIAKKQGVSRQAIDFRFKKALKILKQKIKEDKAMDKIKK